MAKRKDAVALFEVITATKKKEQAALGKSRGASMLRTPKWWFKHKASDGQPAEQSVEPQSYAAPALPAPAEADVPYASPADPTANYVPAAPGVVQRVVPPPAPERVTIPSERNEGTAAFGLDLPAREGAAAPLARARRSWFGLRGTTKKVDLDPDRREVTVRFRYTTAIVAGFAVCVIVGLAYITGRQTNKANAGPNAVSSKAIKDGDILAGVLDIHPDREARTGDNLAEPNDHSQKKEIVPAKPDAGKARSQPKQPPTGQDVEKPTGPRALPGGIEEGLPRVKGLNYVIIQSYGDKKSAEDAAAMLKAGGIDCTVQKAPPGYTADPDWLSVIGTMGFPPKYSTTPEYKRYIQSIEKVNQSYAGKSKMKRFEPDGVKWR